MGNPDGCMAVIINAANGIGGAVERGLNHCGAGAGVNLLVWKTGGHTPKFAPVKGRTVDIASISALSNIGQTNYGMSKASITGFPKCRDRETVRNNFTANAIAPGYMDTDMIRVIPKKTMQQSYM